MILFLISCFGIASAHPVAREWKTADHAIHSTCRGVNTQNELIVSYESQSGVGEHSRLLALATIVELNSIRLQAEQERLTAHSRVGVELRLLSQSILVSMLTIQEQADALNLFMINLAWLQETTEKLIFPNNKPDPRWLKLCHFQATQTSEAAWHTYEVLTKELVKLQLMTARVNAAFMLTLMPIT